MYNIPVLYLHVCLSVGVSMSTDAGSKSVLETQKQPVNDFNLKYVCSQVFNLYAVYRPTGKMLQNCSGFQNEQELN